LDPSINSKFEIIKTVYSQRSRLCQKLRVILNTAKLRRFGAIHCPGGAIGFSPSIRSAFGPRDLSPFQGEPPYGCFPGLKPWAESYSTCGTKTSQTAFNLVPFRVNPEQISFVNFWPSIKMPSLARCCCEMSVSASRRDNTDRSLARSAWESVPRKNRPVGHGMIGRS
jgi:hypothetical protein